MKKEEYKKELDYWFTFFNSKKDEANNDKIQEQVLESIIDKQLFKKKEKFTMKTLIQIAATILIASSAYWAGTLQIKNEESISTDQNQYLLAVYGEAETEKDIALIAKEYGEWMSTSFENGKIVGGQELKLAGDYFEAENQTIKTIEIDQKNQLSGYFIIEAKTYADAKAIAETCPHLSYNGRLALRPFMVRN